MSRQRSKIFNSWLMVELLGGLLLAPLAWPVPQIEFAFSPNNTPAPGDMVQVEVWINEEVKNLLAIMVEITFKGSPQLVSQAPVGERMFVQGEESSDPMVKVIVGFAFPGVEGRAKLFTLPVNIPPEAGGAVYDLVFSAVELRDINGDPISVTSVPSRIVVKAPPSEKPSPAPAEISTPTRQIIVQTTPPGLSVIIDSTSYTSPQTFSWRAGEKHLISVPSPQERGEGVRYVWVSWSDKGPQNREYMVPSENVILTANFSTQYYLTMEGGPGGKVTPLSGWYDKGQKVTIRATPEAGYRFSGWAGRGEGSYTGEANPVDLVLNGPITQTAAFAPISPSNHRPIAKDLTLQVDLNTPKEFSLSAQDEDNDPLTFSIVSFPSKGRLQGTPPSLTYIPNSGATGTDSFTFKVSDGKEESNIATVTITIRQVGQVKIKVDPPSLSLTVEEGRGGSLSQPLQISSSREGIFDWSVQVSTEDGRDWISVDRTAGTIIGAVPSVLLVSVHPAGLLTGAYRGKVTLFVPGASNSPVEVPILLIISERKDQTPPQISELRIDGALIPLSKAITLSFPSSGKKITVNATITDENSVKSAMIEVRGISFYDARPMIFDKNNQYVATLEVPPNSGSAPLYYQVTLFATDSYGNTTKIEGITFEVKPGKLLPEVSQIEVSPRQLPPEGGRVLIRAKVSARDAPVRQVEAVIQKPEGGEEHIKMSLQGDNFYEAVFNAPGNRGSDPSNYLVKIEVTDARGDLLVVEAGSFVVVLDDQPPLLVILKPQDGTTVTTDQITVSGTATDAGRGNNGIASVEVNGISAMTEKVEGHRIALWRATITLKPGENRIVVTAKDGSSRQNSKTLEIRVYSQPRIVSVNLPSELTKKGYDFGLVKVGDTAQFTFWIENDALSTDLLEVRLSSLPSPFGVAQGSNFFSLKPGEKASIVISFTPREPGRFKAFLSIVHTGTNVSSPVQIPLEGAGVKPSGDTPWKVVGTLRLPGFEDARLIALTKGKAYVGRSNGYLTILDLNLGKAIGSLVFSPYLTSVPGYISLSKGKAYVALYNPGGVGQLAVVETEKDIVEKYISVEANPWGVTSDDQKIYVTTGEDQGEVKVITPEGDSYRVAQRFSVGKRPYAVARDSVRGKLVVTCGDSIHILSLLEDKKTVIPMPSPSFGVALLEGRAYIATGESGGSVKVIDLDSDLVVGTISVGGVPIEVGTMSGLIFTTLQNEDMVAIIDPTSNTVKQNIKVGFLPYGIGVDIVANRVYVVNQGDKSISILAQEGDVKLQPRKKGDVNGDGRITPADATLALRLALKITLPSPAQLQAADLNEDGQVTIAEVTTLLRRALNVEG